MSVWFRIKETSLKYNIFMGIPVKCETKRIETKFTEKKRNIPRFVSVKFVSFRFISFRFVSFRFRFAFYRYPVKKIGGCFWFSVFVNFPSTNIFVDFFFAVNRDGDIVRESFSVIFILHSLWYTPLVYVFMNLFFQCDLLCLFFVVIFSQPDVNITWITGHIHRSIVDKIDPTSEYIEMVKKIPYQLHWVTYFCEMWPEEFIYRAFNLSVKILLMNRDEDPPPFF
jgi:hypothetical protein